MAMYVWRGDWGFMVSVLASSLEDAQAQVRESLDDDDYFRYCDRPADKVFADRGVAVVYGEA